MRFAIGKKGSEPCTETRKKKEGKLYRREVWRKAKVAPK